MKGLEITLKKMEIDSRDYHIYSLRKAGRKYGIDIKKLPFTMRILLENLIRNFDNRDIRDETITSFREWGKTGLEMEIPCYPSRVILQDFTGVPAVVDLAGMRNAMKKNGGDPERVNPHIPCHLIIDHSIQVDYFGTEYSPGANLRREFERNRERYALLKWSQNAFRNFHVVPPGKGIIHQVNLEYLAHVVERRKMGERDFLIPDTLIGTDSHTTMINGLGVLGWGVGGIEAEAVMLGEPVHLRIPEVAGVKLEGELKEGVTTTDLVLHLTQILRDRGVVGKFVEYSGEGLLHLPVQDRATIANMSPEYGATCGFFPVDERTIEYLHETGRDGELIEIVERYTKEQYLFNTYRKGLIYSDVIEVDLSDVRPSTSGPKRPQDRITLDKLKSRVREFLKEDFEVEISEEHIAHWETEGGIAPHVRKKELRLVEIKKGDVHFELKDGSIVIASITSCTNTSNPRLIFSAGLLAKKAVERGLRVKPFVKTSLAPGSRVVKDYLERSGLKPYLEALGFHLVGFGCTTCIGNSGPLVPGVAGVIEERDLIVTAVLSGNRNFEARIHPLVKMNFLMSPPLVVAFAIKGKIDFNPYEEPVAHDPNGAPVYLKDIWPSEKEIDEYMRKFLKKKFHVKIYSDLFRGDENWEGLKAPTGEIFDFDPQSTYIKEPPFFENFRIDPEPLRDIKNARCLLLLGDSITTDHISPAGKIPEDSPAGEYLIAHAVEPHEFNTYGSRRGNHEVMVRGTFGNVRLKNRLVPEKEGGWTRKFPENKVMRVYDAAVLYKNENIPLIVIAGKEYGTGSSRDWAAKGTRLLGIRAVIAESFERIHRANLVQMGVIPIQFKEGENAESLGLEGDEEYFIEGIESGLRPNGEIKIVARKNGVEKVFYGTLRVETWMEVEYIRHGGILSFVLSEFIKKK